MKLLSPVSLILTSCVVGCGDPSSRPSDPATNTAVAGHGIAAPVEYVKSVAEARHSAVKTVDVTALKKAIDLFNVQEGRFPRELNELINRKYIPEMPVPPVGSRISYDAQAGSVKIVQQ